MRPTRLAAIPLCLALTAVVACKKDSTTGPSGAGNIACSSADQLALTFCPPSGMHLGLNGAAGTPTIAPTNSNTNVSVATTSFTATGTTNATGNGYWLLVTSGNLRSWGVLTVSGGSFSGDIPLFCGAQVIAFSFSNATGRAYWVANVTLTGCTTPAFRAQLTWDTGPSSSDIDLHLLRPGGSSNTTNDCYYANCQGGGLSWGAAGAAGDPILDVDNTAGYGPENIFITSGPETGDYRVIVYNYNGVASTKATVKIFFDDVEQTRYTSLTLDSPRNWWEVAKVNILTGQITTVNTYSSTPPVAAGAAAVAAPVK